MSLATGNVYACLVCGVYLQGRGKGTHAYAHALEAGHQVFLNLDTARAYCLPEGYLVEDPALDDIVYNLRPSYTPELLTTLATSPEPSLALDGAAYRPGLMGLNNIKSNDWFNACVHLLSAARPLREFFLVEANCAHAASPLVRTFGDLLRRLWNPRAFNAQASPHDALQAVAAASERRFRIGQQSEPAPFLAWFLNMLHAVSVCDGEVAWSAEWAVCAGERGGGRRRDGQRRDGTGRTLLFSVVASMTVCVCVH